MDVGVETERYVVTDSVDGASEEVEPRSQIGNCCGGERLDGCVQRLRLGSDCGGGDGALTSKD